MLHRLLYKDGDVQTIEIVILENVKVLRSNTNVLIKVMDKGILSDVNPFIKFNRMTIYQAKDLILNKERVFYLDKELDWIDINRR